ncbi:MAG: hypothetical protein ABL982_16945, partial [Vicinamibacterales bacterium]
MAAQLTLAAQIDAIAFEATSVKENRTASIDGRFGRTPGRFTVVNLSLAEVIQFAYQIRDYQLIGAPGWA